MSLFNSNEEYKIKKLESSLAQKASKQTTYVEDFPRLGAETDDTARINRAITSAISSGKVLEFKYGVTYTVNTITINANGLEIIGNGAILYNGSTTGQYSLALNGASNVKIKRLNTTGINFTITGSSNILIDQCSINKTVSGGMQIDSSSNVEIFKSIISDTGNLATLNPSYQGCGIYITNNCSSIKIHKCDFSIVRGHGAVYVNGNHTNVNVLDSDFYNLVYRGVCVYNGTTTTGEISRNRVRTTGYNRATGSGVGSNGIYTNTDSLMRVRYNTVQDVLENGIEGGFEEISFNTVINTGTDTTNYPTPSIEGIYGWKKVFKNTVINPNGAGIKYYTTNPISDLFVEGNIIIKGNATTATKAIDISGVTSFTNVNVLRNTSINFAYCVAIPSGLTYTNTRTHENVAVGTFTAVYSAVAIDTTTAGTTANRPTGVRQGYPYFDTTLGKQVCYKGSGQWVDGTGAVV
ncbi:right-handed parallel beta-helix repeat-containing protein [Neobacillus vireti]|uniref:right-handed parallel beta-helix repeat-containing protein n=1 Tax=Neobacillus vireti TaxID=220686 RepID=UPI002FFD6F42